MDSSNGELLTRMGRMEQGLASVAESLAELKGDLKAVLKEVQRVGELEIEHKYSKEAIDRAFTAIRAVELQANQLDKRIDALDGAELLNSRLRKVLWACAIASAVSLTGMFLNSVWQSSKYVDEIIEQRTADRLTEAHK